MPHSTRSVWLEKVERVESMHWTLDVTYGEDYCRARTKHAAANRASVRRMAASLTIPWARKHKCTLSH